MNPEKEKFLDSISLLLEASTRTLLDGFDTASIKKWRNRLVTLPAQIKAGKIKNPAEVERYINIALKAAQITAKFEQQRNLLKLFALLISQLLSAFLVAQGRELAESSAANLPTSQRLTENSQKI